MRVTPLETGRRVDGLYNRQRIKRQSCLDFVFKTFICQKMLYVEYVWLNVVVLEFISSVRQKFQRGGGENMVLIAVEVVPVGSKPSAAVGVRISTGERHGF